MWHHFLIDISLRTRDRNIFHLSCSLANSRLSSWAYLPFVNHGWCNCSRLWPIFLDQSLKNTVEFEVTFFCLFWVQNMLFPNIFAQSVTHLILLTLVVCRTEFFNWNGVQCTDYFFVSWKSSPCSRSFWFFYIIL